MGFVQNAAEHLKNRISPITVGMRQKQSTSILKQSEEVQPYLRSVRNAIHDAIPEAQERISWSMPTFWKGHNIIHFAANKKHIGLYAGEEAVIEFEEILKPYKTSKGTIQIPYKEPLPLDLIARIASWCYETGNHP